MFSTACEALLQAVQHCFRGCIVNWSLAAMAKSILDDLGEEVTGIVSPVSLCMALTVALVRLLNPNGDSSGNTSYVASAYYKEQV